MPQVMHSGASEAVPVSTSSSSAEECASFGAGATAPRGVDAAVPKGRPATAGVASSASVAFPVGRSVVGADWASASTRSIPST